MVFLRGANRRGGPSTVSLVPFTWQHGPSLFGHCRLADSFFLLNQTTCCPQPSTRVWRSRPLSSSFVSSCPGVHSPGGGTPSTRKRRTVRVHPGRACLRGDILGPRRELGSDTAEMHYCAMVDGYRRLSEFCTGAFRDSDLFNTQSNDTIYPLI